MVCSGAGDSGSHEHWGPSPQNAIVGHRICLWCVSIQHQGQTGWEWEGRQLAGHALPPVTTPALDTSCFKRGELLTGSHACAHTHTAASRPPASEVWGLHAAAVPGMSLPSSALKYHRTHTGSLQPQSAPPQALSLCMAGPWRDEAGFQALQPAQGGLSGRLPAQMIPGQPMSQREASGARQHPFMGLCEGKMSGPVPSWMVTLSTGMW